MVPYIGAKEREEEKSSKEATSSSSTISSTKSSQESLLQIIEARLTNTKPVKEHMLKLWDELEHIATGRRFDHNQANKRKGGDSSEDQHQSKKIKAASDTKDTEEDSDSDEPAGSDDGEDSEEDDMSDVSYGENDDGYDSDGLPLPMNGRSASTVSSMFVGSLNEGSKKDKKKNKLRDKNDWVDERFDEIYGKPKKNRPGQRARREKAERKYGKDANHVKKAAEEALLREERKAARKAKQEKSMANAQRVPNRRTLGAGDGSASVHKVAAPRAPAAPEPTDPSLHPSWLAKKSEKAAVAAALSGAKSSKIVFDDSD
ncbi:hypothetical protein BG004_001810 [Podila humilis]|nr:hypothetical protein BG004_001810 [Podila humilis]